MSLLCPYLTSVTAVCTAKSTDQCDSVSVVSVSDHAVCTQLSKLTSVSKCQVDSVESLNTH